MTPPAASSASARSIRRRARPSRKPRRAKPLSLRDLLGDALARAAEVERLLSNPDTFGDAPKAAELGREHRRLQPIVELAAQLGKSENELAEARELVSVDDPEMAAEATQEVARLEAGIADLEVRLKPALLPHDPMDDRNAIIEIRAGTGGDEAALFAADL
ncbi:MAG: PCRF domain-containing protein, partial [bacterium]